MILVSGCMIEGLRRKDKSPPLYTAADVSRVERERVYCPIL